MKNTLDISWATIFKIGLAAIMFYIVFQARDIFAWLVFALIISILFNPAIRFLQKMKLPRVVATIIVYLGFFGLFGYITVLAVPFFIHELKEFMRFLPAYFDRLSPLLEKTGIEMFSNFDAFQVSLQEMSGGIFSVISSVFGGVSAAFFVLLIAFFLSLEEKVVERGMSALFPKKYENFAFFLWQKCQRKVSSWFSTRIISCIFVGLMTFFVLLFFGVEYPLLLGLISGIFNFVPYIGAFVAGIIIFLLTINLGMEVTIFVVSAYFIIQMIEGNILTPILSKKFVDLSPVLVIMAMAVGGALWGFIGALLAIPLAGILFEFLREFLAKQKAEEPEEERITL